MRVLLAVIAFLACSAALAQQPTPQLHPQPRILNPALSANRIMETAPPAGMEILFTPQADRFVYDGTYLILDGVAPVIPFFVDRPLRISGAITPAQFAEIWALSLATLKTRPPIATVAAISANRTPAPVVELESVSTTESTMTFKVRLISGDLPEYSGPGALIFRPQLWWPRVPNAMANRTSSGPGIACFLNSAMGQSICHGIETPVPSQSPE